MLLFEDNDTSDDDHYTQHDNKREPVIQPRHILEVHPVPSGDQGQREEDRRYHGQELHVAVLFCVNLRLIRIFYLLGVFKQVACPAHEPVRTVSQSTEIFQMFL